VKKINHLLILLVGLAAFAYPLARYNDTDFRYAGYQCQHDMIFNEEGDIDLAVIGSSRTQLGVGAPELAKGIEPAFGRDVVVYDLAKGWRGQGINYTIIRDLIENRQVKNLLIEANLHESGIYHAHWFLVGQYQDLFQTAIFQQGNGLNLTVLFTPLKMIADRFVERSTQLILGDFSLAVNRDNKDKALTRSCTNTDEPINPVRLRDRYLHAQKYYQEGFWSWDMYKDLQLHDTGFFKTLKQLADENEINLAFYYVHERHYLELDPAFAETFFQEVGVPLLIPPADLVQQLEKDGYADPTHMRANGRALYSGWLAEEFVTRSNFNVK